MSTTSNPRCLGYKMTKETLYNKILTLDGGKYRSFCKMVSDVSPVLLTETPYQTEFDVISICTSGYIKSTYRGQEAIFEKNCFSLLLNDSLCEFKERSEDFKGEFIFLSLDFAQKLKFEDYLPLTLFFRYHPILKLSDDEMDHLVQFFKLLKVVIEIDDNQGKEKMIRTLFGYLFQLIQQMREYNDSKIMTEEKRIVEIFSAFDSLLKVNYKKSRASGFYADKLCISSNYLYKVVKTMTGLSTKDFIMEHIILEAKRMLDEQENVDVQKVALELGFPNQSSFSKCFKLHLGVSPSEYKRE